MPQQFSNLLDQDDIKSQPAELKKICRIIFFTGKALRSELASQVSGPLALKPKEKIFLSRIIEYIHNSSLLHDDFIDHSLVRRNHKTAWLEFSPSQAVLAGDFLLSKVNVHLAQAKNLFLIKSTAEVICELAQGEFLQRELLPFKDKKLKNRDKVSELKTSSLFRWCLQAPFFFKHRRNSDLHKLLKYIGSHFGLLFQRSDDLMDFCIRNQEKKPGFSDLKQKYFNSFACFLLQDSCEETEKYLQTVRSLSQLKRRIPDLESKVKAFDNINLKLIKKTEKSICRLKPFLKKKERPMIESLKAWPYFLYWRKDKI